MDAQDRVNRRIVLPGLAIPAVQHEKYVGCQVILQEGLYQFHSTLMYNMERIVSGHGEEEKKQHAQNLKRVYYLRHVCSFMCLPVSVELPLDRFTRNLMWGLLRVAPYLNGAPAGTPLSCEKLQI